MKPCFEHPVYSKNINKAYFCLLSLVTIRKNFITKAICLKQIWSLTIFFRFILINYYKRDYDMFCGIVINNSFNIFHREFWFWNTWYRLLEANVWSSKSSRKRGNIKLNYFYILINCKLSFYVQFTTLPNCFVSLGSRIVSTI